MTINDGFKVFDPRLMTSFSKSNFKEVIKKSLFKSLRGKAQIKGTGELVALYPYLENEANKMGVAGVINAYYHQYNTLTIKLPVPVLDKNGIVVSEELKEHTFFAKGNDRDKLFAVLENDVDMSPDLEGIDDDLEKLEVILDAIFHDIVISKKKIYFVFPQDPDDED
ncbi:20248_t:CDS:2 [Gigaspora margarita]|uniref:20248_t:CDS:1 n=1 Tax=Gigaspora margarita TaxID=4874 RepID=A0ABN7WSJ7_GIGMA|nr:20248_t:CDS:2 [Gigaspora margarita]